jgi:hypothetical protein
VAAQQLRRRGIVLNTCAARTTWMQRRIHANAIQHSHAVDDSDANFSGAGAALLRPGEFIMRRASPRLLTLAPLAGPLLLILAPAVAGHADDSAAPAADATGMTIMVKNCNDSGPGSLRAAVARALSGDTIDLRGLTCRRINLTSGAIMVPQDDLSLVGRGAAVLTVDANRLSSVFRHSGSGWLRIDGMTIARGYHFSGDPSQPALGGCLYSAGSIDLRSTLVHWCYVGRIRDSGVPRYNVMGGGLYAEGAVTLTDSQILGNTAHYGGGIYSQGRLTAYRSRICGNHAFRGYGGAVSRGGLTSNYTTFSDNSNAVLQVQGGRISIANSTISGNRSRGINIYLQPSSDGGLSTGSTMIVNSTISGNSSGSYTMLIWGNAKSIVNSTIAFNQHFAESCAIASNYATVRLTNQGYRPAHIESTIIANSSCNGGPSSEVEGSVVEGANNLITLSNLSLPPDTMDADPRLALLADNGGLTEAHALLDDSPAIDMGNNAAGLAYDQRGAGFPRVKGPQADIGAYER